MTKFKCNLTLEDATDIQFTNLAGANTGKIESDGNNLVLSNAVGDILLGDGASDVYVGNGTDSVDIRFEVSGSLSGESGAALTLGGAGGTLALGSALALGSNNLTGGGTITGTTLTGTSLDINGAADISGDLTGCAYKGDVIESGYLDSDTAHLTTTQTFTGAKTFTNTVALTGTGRITGVDTVSASTDAASKAYVDGRSINEGATANGDLDLNENKITGLSDPQGEQDAATKAYADTKSPREGSGSLTTVGTIGTGVWNGTVIAEAKLQNQSGTNTGDQTTISGNAGTVTNGVYNTGNQTIAGSKTFSSPIKGQVIGIGSHSGYINKTAAQFASDGTDKVYIGSNNYGWNDSRDYATNLVDVDAPVIDQNDQHNGIICPVNLSQVSIMSQVRMNAADGTMQVRVYKMARATGVNTSNLALTQIATASVSTVNGRMTTLDATGSTAVSAGDLIIVGFGKTSGGNGQKPRINFTLTGTTV